MFLNDFLSLLDGVKEQSGGGYMTRCPAHSDNKSSLSVREGRDCILIKCFAGCQNDVIVAALGLTMRDLFYNSTVPIKPHRINDKSKKVSFDLETKYRYSSPSFYDYVSESNELLYKIIRYYPNSNDYNDKKFIVVRPDYTRAGYFFAGFNDNTRRVLYNLPKVLTAVKNNEPVYIVEGEKDANNISDKLNCIATTCANGANGWRDEYANSLIGADVVIIPDCDSAGANFCKRVIQSLTGKANSIKVCDLYSAFNVPENDRTKELKDISDFLLLYSKTDVDKKTCIPNEFIIGKLYKGCELVYKKESISEHSPLHSKSEPFSLGLSNEQSHLLLPSRMLGSDLMKIEFPYHPYIVEEILPKGFYIFGAPEKSGKSFFALDILGAVASGGKFLNYQCLQGFAAYFTLDGDGYERIKKRLLALYGKDFPFFANIYFAKEAANINNFAKEVHNLSKYRPDLRLIYIDLLPDIRGSSTSKFDYDIDRHELGILRDLAESNNIVIIANLHTTKMQHDNETHNIMGTVGVSGTATGSITLVKKRVTDKCGVLTFKSRDTETLKLNYEFGAHTGFKFINLGHHVSVNESSAKDTKMTQAEMFLRGVLGNGEQHNSAEIKDLAKKFGISPRSLQYAREKIGIIIHRRGTKDDIITYWQLS